MYTKRENRYPGKFEPNASRYTAEVLYGIAGCGCDEEIGSVDQLGWFGLVKGKRYTFVVHEDNLGFFYYEEYRNREDAMERWEEIEEKYSQFYDRWEGYM